MMYYHKLDSEHHVRTDDGCRIVGSSYCRPRDDPDAHCPARRVEHPPYDGYSMTHHHCPTESHRTDGRTGSVQNGTVFHFYLD